MFEDFLKKNAPTPWVNLIADEKDDEVKINMWNRQYTVGKNCLLSSIVSGGEEMLDGPMTIHAIENGEEVYTYYPVDWWMPLPEPPKEE